MTTPTPGRVPTGYYTDLSQIARDVKTLLSGHVPSDFDFDFVDDAIHAAHDFALSRRSFGDEAEDMEALLTSNVLRHLNTEQKTRLARTILPSGDEGRSDFDPIWEMQKHDAYAKAQKWFGNPQPAPVDMGDSGEARSAKFDESNDGWETVDDILREAEDIAHGDVGDLVTRARVELDSLRRALASRQSCGLTVVDRVRYYTAMIERLTAEANHDLAKVGEWSCNYSEGFNEYQGKIEALLSTTPNED